MATWRDKITSKAKHVTSTLKAEYEAGKSGDDAPVATIWGTPKEQLDAILGHVRAQRAARPVKNDTSPDRAAAVSVHEPASPDQTDRQTTSLDADADEVVRTLSGIDWAGVRSATSERTSDAAAAMRTMADQVDWAKVQPMAAQVSSALIAAVASGRVRVGGPMGSVVARAIIDQGGLGQKVAERVQVSPSMVPDFRGAIEVRSREV